MLHLGCTYLIVKDMAKSIAFYEELLEMKAKSKNLDRWALFSCGNNIALYNPQYDINLIKSGVELSENFSEGYLSFKNSEHVIYGNNAVLNFNTDDLGKEYRRVKALNIGKVTEIMYVNIVMPYYFFMVEDPDGNKIEITGKYHEKC